MRRIWKIENKRFEITLYRDNNDVEVHLSDFTNILTAHKDFERYMTDPHLIAYKVEKEVDHD